MNFIFAGPHLSPWLVFCEIVIMPLANFAFAKKPVITAVVTAPLSAPKVGLTVTRNVPLAATGIDLTVPIADGSPYGSTRAHAP